MLVVQEKMFEPEAMPESGRTRSGKARMNNLTPEQRKELAQRAAASRWATVSDPNLKIASHIGDIILADGLIVIPCAVLEDGTRVLTERGFLSAIGRRGRPKNTLRSTDEGFDKIAPFLAAENLSPYISDDLRADSVPVAFKTTAGAIAWGYRADLLPKVCDVYLKARDSKDISNMQAATVTACDTLMRALAHVGIIALVDEATGYQNERARDALAQILEAFIAKELQPWVSTFPNEYYEQLFRLRGLEFPQHTIQRPQYFGILTNDIVYKRLAPGVLEELKKVADRNEAGRPKHKYFQRLTSNLGYQELRSLLKTIVAIMKLSSDYHDFIGKLDIACPRHGQLVLPLNYEQSSDNGKGL